MLTRFIAEIVNGNTAINAFVLSFFSWAAIRGILSVDLTVTHFLLLMPAWFVVLQLTAKK
ncbi:hypothetical protein [Dethiobacter alkaliphilus]|uniref:hypothetical protein n=1 Tax=Dethiobacter alkaliphilus TaxID=427926 RepID=UPI0022269B47|nr:hypothetical protein [Dethiobacter alkaliphilus]MCW3489447.1 hypothetical protein [Dethiobacter alkaliphilus]